MFRSSVYEFLKLSKPLSRKCTYATSTASINLGNGINLDAKTAQTVKPSLTPPPRASAWADAKPLRTMPGPAPWPLIGNTWRFTHGEFKGLDPVGLYKSLRDTYGPICRLTNIIGVPDSVILFDPSLVQEMYQNEGAFPERNMLECINYYRRVVRKDVYGDGVYGLPVSSGEEWYKLRSAVNPILLQPRISEEFIPKIETAAREFVNRMGRLAASHPQMKDDFIYELNKYSLESVSYVALNRRFGLLNDELTDETKQIMDSTIRVFELIYELGMQPSFWKLIPTPTWREYVRHMDFLTGVYIRVIDEQIEHLMKTTHFETDEERCILQKFLHVDKRVAVAVVFDTLAAGIDTTSKTIGAVMYLLGKHKRAQRKLRREILQVFPDADTPITPAHLNKCKYLKAVIKESARLHGVAIAQLRTATKDFVLGGYQIPKGINVIGAQCIMAKSDDFIHRAKEFIPERFMRECANEEYSMTHAHKHIYHPFGFGPRSCVGRRLANLELEISLALILRKFRFDWREANMKFKATIMYGLSDPLKIHIYPIEHELDDPNEDLDKIDYSPELD